MLRKILNEKDILFPEVLTEAKLSKVKKEFHQMIGQWIELKDDGELTFDLEL